METVEVRSYSKVCQRSDVHYGLPGNNSHRFTLTISTLFFANLQNSPCIGRNCEAVDEKMIPRQNIKYMDYILY